MQQAGQRDFEVAFAALDMDVAEGHEISLHSHVHIHGQRVHIKYIGEYGLRCAVPGIIEMGTLWLMSNVEAGSRGWTVLQD